MAMLRYSSSFAFWFGFAAFVLCGCLSVTCAARVGSLSSAPFPYELVRGTPYNVSYDSRALLINGERVFLQSGSFHYPRTTVDHIPQVLSKFKANQLNTVQIYIFWNLHEAVQGQLDFSSELRNFTAVFQAAQQLGLFVNLRIGPYACAEWNYGGIPFWLKQQNGVVFRTDNSIWENAMASFMTAVVKISEPWFARNGGPIILAQVENEYGNFEAVYGSAGHTYMLWAANFAVTLEPSLVWIMCVQDDAPASVVQTCNGFYCDQWISGHVSRQPQQPHMWTEDWSGWFQDWGEAKPHRPAQDLAFAVARWVMLGGAFHNYYMFYGGTNFGRWSGGPFITTTYDYDAPLNEYGGTNEPKYSHGGKLHEILQSYAPAIVGSDSIPTVNKLGPNQEGNVYGTFGTVGSIAFLANIDANNAYTVTFQGQQFTLPPWSVSVVDGASLAVLYNTATITATALPIAVESVQMQSRIVQQSLHAAAQIFTIPEAIGYSKAPVQSSATPLESLSVTLDQTDYLWYTLPIELTSAQITKGSVTLTVDNLNDVFYAFIDTTQLATGRSITSKTSFTLSVASFAVGSHLLSILALTNGLINYGAYLETTKRGLLGSISIDGQALSPAPSGQWSHYPFINGELLQYYLPQTSAPWNSDISSAVGQPMTWWKVLLPQPPSNASNGYALDLSSMGKGFAYVNGHHIGRYWLLKATASTCSPCSYAGAYDGSKCRTGCGDYSQQYYRVPEAWLRETGTQPVVVILFDEVGGDPSQIQWKTY